MTKPSRPRSNGRDAAAGSSLRPRQRPQVAEAGQRHRRQRPCRSRRPGTRPPSPTRASGGPRRARSCRWRTPPTRSPPGRPGPVRPHRSSQGRASGRASGRSSSPAAGGASRLPADQPLRPEAEHDADARRGRLPPAGVARAPLGAPQGELVERVAAGERGGVAARRRRARRPSGAATWQGCSDVEARHGADAGAAGQQVVGELVEGVAQRRAGADAGDPDGVGHGSGPHAPRHAAERRARTFFVSASRQPSARAKSQAAAQSFSKNRPRAAADGAPPPPRSSRTPRPRPPAPARRRGTPPRGPRPRPAPGSHSVSTTHTPGAVPSAQQRHPGQQSVGGRAGAAARAEVRPVAAQAQAHRAGGRVKRQVRHEPRRDAARPAALESAERLVQVPAAQEARGRDHAPVRERGRREAGSPHRPQHRCDGDDRLVVGVLDRGGRHVEPRGRGLVQARQRVGRGADRAAQFVSRTRSLSPTRPRPPC